MSDKYHYVNSCGEIGQGAGGDSGTFAAAAAEQPRQYTTVLRDPLFPVSHSHQIAS